jgi:hypothetical protein
MEAAMALAAPGPEHEILATMAGTWDLAASFFSEPGAAPQTSSLVAEQRMILGGRFLESRARGETMGEEMESLGILGYDRRHRKYTTVGFDTWGTYYVTAAGDYDPETRTLTMQGEDLDPHFGLQRFTMTTRFASDDELVYELVFHQPDGTEWTMLEILYTRRK